MDEKFVTLVLSSVGLKSLFAFMIPVELSANR